LPFDRNPRSEEEERFAQWREDHPILSVIRDLLVGYSSDPANAIPGSGIIGGVVGAGGGMLDDAARLGLRPTRGLPPKGGLVARIQSKLELYPKVVDPRTGRNINFPSGTQHCVPKADRVTWTGQDRYTFIKEWHDRGYATPKGGWDRYDIHHIQPREFGGTNDFLNLVPVERNTHRLFNDFWREFMEM
jgi:hypothetical protein